VHTAEALAYADGSAAWATMTGNGSMFFAWLDQGVAAGLLDGRAVTAVTCTVAQMTGQELATLIRTEVPAVVVVVVVVVDNNGYTVERHPWTRRDLQRHLDLGLDAGSGPVRWRPGRGGRPGADRWRAAGRPRRCHGPSRPVRPRPGCRPPR
jgi:hypothetical protein